MKCWIVWSDFAFTDTVSCLPTISHLGGALAALDPCPLEISFQVGPKRFLTFFGLCVETGVVIKVASFSLIAINPPLEDNFPACNWPVVYSGVPNIWGLRMMLGTGKFSDS